MSKSKTTAVTKQSEQYENPWLEVAAESGNETGRLLKFIKGEWTISDDAVPENSEFVAHLDQLIRGWVKFEDGKVVDRVIGKVADGFKPPEREQLSDNDPKKWRDRDSDDKPRDPWAVQWFLPLIGVTTGELVTYITGSKGGIGAIADLCWIYGHKKRDGLLPIIALKVRDYKHKQYGKIETPDFQIVGWDGAGPQAAATPVQPQPKYPPSRIETHPRRMQEEDPPPHTSVPDGDDSEIPY